MPSDKRNSIATKAIWVWFLHCSTTLCPKMCLFANRCSSNACIMVLSKFTFVPLCSPFLSPLLQRWRFAVTPLCGFLEDLVTAVIAEVFNTLSFGLNQSVNCWTTLKMPFCLYTVTNRFWERTLSRVDCPYFQIMARRDTFHALLCV